jgi:cyanate permease
MTLPFGILFGISFGSMIPLRPVITSLMFGNKAAGSIIGLTQGGAIAAGVAGPLVMGYVFDSTGSYYGSVWVLGIVTFLTLPLVFFMDSPSKLSRALSDK